MQRPRWNRLFRWVKVGEVPPYGIVIHATIIDPLMLIESIAKGNVALTTFWAVLLVIHCWLTVSILRETFGKDVLH